MPPHIAFPRGSLKCWTLRSLIAYNATVCPERRGTTWLEYDARMHLHELHPSLSRWMAALDTRLTGLLVGEAVFLHQAAAAVLGSPGKRLRPAILLLAAATCTEACPPRVVDGAALVELVHSASLAHDDVLDDAALRRGTPSAPARWGNKLAVLVGDYLVSRAYELAAELGLPELQRHLAEVAVAMTRGVVCELTGLHLDATDDDYWAVVDGKTSALFGFAAANGALLVDATPAQCRAMRAFGQSFGRAFQLADDLLDLQGSELATGKPLQVDWSQRRATLPLLLALRHAPIAEARAMRALWHADPFTAVEHEALRTQVATLGGFDAGWETVNRYREQACAFLAAMPETAGRAALMRLCGEDFPLPVLPAMVVG